VTVLEDGKRLATMLKEMEGVGNIAGENNPV